MSADIDGLLLFPRQLTRDSCHSGKSKPASIDFALAIVGDNRYTIAVPKRERPSLSLQLPTAPTNRTDLTRFDRHTQPPGSITNINLRASLSSGK